jgi:hypothetical protein
MHRIDHAIVCGDAAPPLLHENQRLDPLHDFGLFLTAKSENLLVPTNDTKALCYTCVYQSVCMGAVMGCFDGLACALSSGTWLSEGRQ